MTTMMAASSNVTAAAELPAITGVSDAFPCSCIFTAALWGNSEWLC